MNPLWRIRISSFAPAAALVAGLALMLLNPGGWRTHSLTVSLQLATATRAEQVSTRVAFVDIDDASLVAAGAWPWPRTQIAQLVQATQDAGADTIVLALPLAGPDAAAPQRAIEAWIATGADRNAATTLARAPDTDAVLLDVLEQTETTLGLFPGGSEDVAPLGPVEFTGSGGEAFLPRVGFDARGPIADRATRRIPLALANDVMGRPAGAYIAVRAGETVLPAAAALPLLGGEDASLTGMSNGRPGTIGFVDPVGISAFEAGGQSISTLSDGLVLFRRDLSVPRLSASDVLQGDGELISERIVFVGSSLARVNGRERLAPGLSRAEAASIAAAHVAAHATPARPFVFMWLEVLFVLVVGAGCISLAQTRRAWIGFGVGIFAAAAAYALSTVLLSNQNSLFDSAATALVLLLTASIALVVSESRRQTTRQNFAHAIQGKLPLGAPTRLNKNPRKLLEEAESRKITALCCAIRDFHEIQELFKDDPNGLASIVQQFQELVGDQVRRFGGTVDRFGGGTILAFWNVPVDDPDHAISACDCALRLVDGLEGLNQKIEAQAFRTGKPFAPIHIGIGINTGRAVAGNVGSKDRPAYSAVGDTVTLARQLLESSADYGPAIVVGEHTYQPVKNRFALLEIDKIQIPRRSFAVRVFALLGNPVTKASPRFRALEDAHEAIFDAYRTQNWSLAEALINECRKLNGAIPSLYDLYEQRIAFYRHFPPASDWDGAFETPVL